MFKKLKLVGPVVALLVTGVVALHAAYSNPVQDATSPYGTAEYATVLNGDNVAHEIGDVVVFATDTTYGIKVTTTTTANNGLVAGVIAQHDCAANSLCVVQTRGYHSGVTIGVANSAGDSLVTSTTGEATSVYTIAQATGTAANQAVISGVFAVALETTTSSTTVKAYLFGR